MRRIYDDYIEKWYVKSNKKPLVIRGARQVGKSTLVRNFASGKGLKLFEVNLERHPQLLKTIEKLDPKLLLQEIEFICKQGKIHAEDSIVFLDEIQGVPQALQILRYFYEEIPELAVVSAGSLLEFALSDSKFPMPVGRIEYFYMGPLSFEEYILVSGNHDLFELIASWTFEKVFPDSAHQRLLELLRSYFLIGGMPEAVNHYIEYEDFAEVYSIQESILQTYRDDFSKYAQGSNLIRLQKILDYLGQGLGDKIKYVNIDRDSQARELKTAIDLLAKAGIIFKVKHSHADAIPLNAQLEERVFKLFSLDLGIYNRICELDYIPPSSDWDDRFVNEGKLAEQFIAQHLFLRKSPKQKPELHYWLRNKKSENAEVDFLCSINQNIIPIEVKSGKSGSLKSLQQFVIDKDHKLACRFDLNQPSEQRVSCSLNSSSVDYHLINLPLYMVGQFKRIMENL